MNQIKMRNRVLGTILFVAYLIIMTYFLFFSDDFGRSGREIGRYAYNIIPFKEISRFIEYRKSLGIKAYVINIYGNIIAFMPLGFFLPVVSIRRMSCVRTVLYSFILSLIIETIQLLTFTGSFDVDDIILNTIGGFIGYLIFKLVCWITKPNS